MDHDAPLPIELGPLRPEEKTFLAEHSLKRPLRVLDIWALGVGVVITGEYFGWNLALKNNGPVAVLVASLIVCLLYLTWVLALSELSVAMPFAGGPLAYGRRAVDTSLGFVMGWSMFLECQFATIATGLATGGYIAFLINPAHPSPMVQVWSALATVVIFCVLQIWGVKEQSLAMVIMTYGAILGLVVFWCLAATNFSWDRVWTSPLLPADKGWRAVLDAIPYCLWWLVIIETVALAAEEAHEPHRTIPRGLVWGQLTLIVLVVLTWLFACGAMDNSQELAVDAEGHDISYPLAKVVGSIPIGRSPSAVYGFGLIALFGMIASFHGMLFGTSRQAFALGRGGYLPAFLGTVHPPSTDAGGRARLVRRDHRRLRGGQLVVRRRRGDCRLDLDPHRFGLVHPGGRLPVRAAAARTGDVRQLPRAARPRAAGDRRAPFGICDLRLQRHRRQSRSAHRLSVCGRD